jgi:glucokinase
MLLLIRRDHAVHCLDMRRLGLLGDFVATCIFIVALCHTMLARIAERSTAGTKSFVCLGPMSFLRDIGG